MAAAVADEVRLLIAGGGTGGHLFPGVAVAQEVRKRHPDAAIRFVGTERGIEARVLPDLGWDLELIDVSGLKTVGLWGKIKGLFRLPRALWQSRRLIKTFKPTVVIGVGGYASGPVVLAARLSRKPTAVLEQNSVPGMTNKILGKLVRRIFISFSESRRFFPKKKIVLSGNPIRAEIRAALTDAAASSETDAPEPAPRLFVFGGSQGAMAVNKLTAEAAAILAGRDVSLSIVHQTGERDRIATEARYRNAGIGPLSEEGRISADCRAFIVDMVSEYQRADLVLARAGATTIAELGVVGRPAILIPYPHAADNHQVLNAKEMADEGAAIMMQQADLTAETLADTIEGLVTDEARRARMGSAMKALGQPGAADIIVDWLESPA